MHDFQNGRNNQRHDQVIKKANVIFDVDKIRTNIDSHFPNTYLVEFPLDSTPEHIWQEIFEYEWKFSRDLWDRKLAVIGEKVRLMTTPDEIEEKIDWVKNVIAN